MPKQIIGLASRSAALMSIAGWLAMNTLVVPGLAQAQSIASAATTAMAAPATKPWGTPTLSDWNSVWIGYNGPLVKSVRRSRPEPTAEYAPYMEASKRASAEHKELMHSARCLPLGVPGNAVFVYPIDLIVQPRQVTILYESGGFRRIRMNGRHPDYVEPSFVGDSIARWEGDTLLIDTVGITTKTILYGESRPTSVVRHSNRLHVVERLREVQPGYIEYRIWMEDPRAFVKPIEWAVGMKKAPNEEVVEHVCEHSFETQFSFDAFDQIPEPEQTEVHWAESSATKTH